ncbi:MAG: hypothetical protein Hyperionvirus38_12 [Hyperionvirus sp.]|uniref:Uncharacterized protein n=1 Tax=Hyperionvirus sp. TaxID=2487770 RepID=A0A3G5ADS9_9VIRU|nr:MAG: hypothetical protein Hyperionvirus38_12 [Hyperionvirus sp.]
MVEGEAIFKIVIIGDTNTGKSAVHRRFVDEKFNDKAGHTIGLEFGAKMVHYGGKSIRLQIWDTAGHESFRTIIRPYYSCAHGAVICFDVNNLESFHKIDYWFSELSNNCVVLPKIVVLATKVEPDGPRVVSKEQIVELEKKMKLPVFETSAKLDQMIRASFLTLVSLIEDDATHKRNVAIDKNPEDLSDIKTEITLEDNFHDDMEYPRSVGGVKEDRPCCSIL